MLVSSMKKIYVLGLLALLFLSACRSAAEEEPAALPLETPTTPATRAADAAPTIPAAGTNPRLTDVTPVAVPKWARPDAIPPIYAPNFAPANEVSLRDDELVMGVALEGEAKAYPVTVMQFREIVNDEMAGIPILVTW